MFTLDLYFHTHIEKHFARSFCLEALNDFSINLNNKKFHSDVEFVQHKFPDQEKKSTLILCRPIFYNNFFKSILKHYSNILID